MKKPTEKKYIYATIDQNGYEENHTIEAYGIKEARKIANMRIGNNMSGQRQIGHIRIYKD